MARAVGLQEHPGPRQALPAAAVAGRPMDVRGRQPRLGKDPPQRPLRHRDPLALGEQLGQMGPVDPGIGARGKPHQALAEDRLDPVGGCPAGVPVAQGGRPLARIGRQQAAHLARGAVQDGRPLLEGQGPVGEVYQHLLSLLGSSVMVGSRSSVHARHSDKVAGRLRVTESLAVHTATTASLDLLTLAAYVADLRTRPKCTGVWKGAPDARIRALARGASEPLSLNTVNAYMRPLRALCLWLLDEGILAVNPFRRTHRRAGLNPLLPSEETPPKSAPRADLAALERGCAGEGPLELRDQAIVSVLKTTAARSSAVRLLRIEDLDLAHGVLLFRRGKGGKTLEVALHPESARALAAYLEGGRAALLGDATFDPGFVCLSAHRGQGPAPLTRNSLSLMLRRRYRNGGGTLPTFGAHRIRHATATLLVNHGMPLEEVSRYLGHSSVEVTRRYARATTEALARAGLVEG